MKRLLFGCAIVLFVVCMFGATAAFAQTDNIKLFVNGSIYKDAGHKVNNLLVKNGVVAGHNVDPKKYPGAEIVDLKGAAAYPGFNDSHIHLQETGLFYMLGSIR